MMKNRMKEVRGVRGEGGSWRTSEGIVRDFGFPLSSEGNGSPRGCERRTDTINLDLKGITLAAMLGLDWGSKGQKQGDQLRCYCSEK